jgi:hypothetical protein
MLASTRGDERRASPPRVLWDPTVVAEKRVRAISAKATATWP